MHFSHRAPAASAARALLFPAVFVLGSCTEPTPPSGIVPRADHLVFIQQPTDVQAGIAMSPAVRVQAVDKNGEPVETMSGQEINLILQSVSGTDTLKGQATSIFQGSQAIFASVVLDKVASGLKLAAVTSKVTGALSSPFNVSPGTPSALRFSVQPDTTQVAGEPMTPAPKVEIQDSRGNKVATFTGSAQLRVRTGRGDATLFNGTVACSNGECAWPNAKIDKAAVGYTVTASIISSASGSFAITDATSTVFEVKPAAAKKLVFATSPSNNLANAVFSPPIQVEVTDTLGNTVTTASNSITLAFSNNPNGAALGGTLTVTASAGVAKFPDVSVNKAGVNYRLSATTSGLETALSNFFSTVNSSIMDGFSAGSSLRAPTGSSVTTRPPTGGSR